ncbi:MAG: outer membrane protein transport protein [Phycisphaerales bacterium]|nr:MAG: outer membrane protein transport protein [Phycisphaerales bacterium]
MTEAEDTERENLYERHAKRLSPGKTVALIFVLWASFPSGVCADIETKIPITPKPVGSGARALGQSAFIAVADDATAASWNPAGLINLERPEVSFVGAWRSVEEAYSIADPRAFSSPESWSDSELNFMSYAQPCALGNTDVVLSVNYHQVYDFGVEFNLHQTHWLRSGTKLVIQNEGKSEGAVSAYTLAGGLSIPDYPQITVGGGINLYAQGLLNDYAWQIKKTKTITTYYESPTVSKFTHIETFDGFRAHNFTLGLLWDAYEEQENLLTFGLVYHTPFTAKVDWEIVYHQPNAPTYRPGIIDMDIDFPRSFGAGVNYRFSDSLSAALDVEWKEWSKYMQTSANGTETFPFNDDTLAYRLGFEHIRFPESTEQPVFALRGGAFYEPRPAWEEILSVYGLSVGLGWTFREQFSLDFAYQHRWAEEDLGNMDYEIKEDFLVASVIVYF